MKNAANQDGDFGKRLGINRIRLGMRENETHKEWRGIKITGNVFIYNYILCIFFFHGLGSFTFLAKDLLSKSLGFNVQNCNFYFAKSTTSFSLRS